VSRTGLYVAVGLCLGLWAGGAWAAERDALGVRTEWVSFESGSASFKGVLWLPSGRPKAGVVLLDDAGKTLEVERYAALLAGRGFVVLAYEPKGAPSPGDTPEAPGAGVHARAEQALAAARVLRGRVGPLKDGPVGLMGLGRGAWVAVRAAASSPEPGFLVLVSGGGGPVWKQDAHRRRNDARQRGLTGPEQADLAESLSTLYDARLYEPKSEARARRTLDFQLKRAKRKRWYPMSPLRRLEHLEPPRLLEAQRQEWRDVLSYDSTEDLGRLRCPVLALVGEQDVVAPAKATVQALSRAVARSGTPSPGAVTVQVLSGRELLIPGPPGVEPEAEPVWAAMEAWLGELERVSVSTDAGP